MAAASRKEEERNERVVRGLLKLPPNRRCVNCNGLGPQYVCTSFWTFVCISCSGIHREFTHRVKSVSMSKFSTQEVEALQKGGNQRARESFLKDFDTQKMRLPDSSNIDSLREFIKAVYVERRYTGGRFSERPPRVNQNQKAHEEEHRRASSYHSFSQSPPYDHQYEDRRIGKQSAFLSRKPGSDRGHDGKISGFAYRSHSLHERMTEDGFGSESCGSRTSNCSGSSMSDTVRTAPQSPNFLDNGCFSPPVLQDQSKVQSLYGLTTSQRTASAGNMDSISFKSGNSSLPDLIFEDDNVCRTQKSTNSAFSDATTTNTANQDLLNPTAVKKQPVTRLDESVDLFANMPPTTTSADKVIPATQSMDNAGWATFDTPPEEKQPAVTGLSYVAAAGNGKQALSRDLFSFEPNDQSTLFHIYKEKASVTNQFTATSLDTRSSQAWSVFDATNGSTQYTLPGDLSQMTTKSQEPKGPMDENGSQLWHSFDDVNGVVAHYPPCAQPRSDEHKNAVNFSLSTSNPFTCSVASKDSHDDFHKVFMDELSPNTPHAAFAEPSLGGASTEQVPLNPFDLPFDNDSEIPNLFMDVSSLQEALPNPDLPDFLDGLPETWFSNSPCAYVPSASHGGLPCLVEQAPNSPLRNIPVGAVSTGNPFA
ncbi:probable ADP-ribosylation factor GTPase-activating protein AGD14 isoform X2 [Phragmites australis]|uniref:probable ADP-ribosylation factor GTPase-activating protein AGD14 isoform X2 n=1 Tax=Phragmites australis TaxID=29695 RepID=UPI002D797961|nr:probable ADP-ribosylation factor GTPase-activating protein AGD14 isoform X2 [Phragmites australis]